MIGTLAAWPLSAWLTVLPLLAACLGWLGKQLWLFFVRRSARFERREEAATALVDLLRRALDKGLIRENGLASTCEILTIAIQHVPEPRPVIIELAVQRALEHLTKARDACAQIDRGLR